MKIKASFYMSKNEKIIFFLIILLAIFLRFYHLAEYPLPGETADEYKYFWIGHSLLHYGSPIGWSWLESYPPGSREVTHYLSDKYKLAMTNVSIEPQTDLPIKTQVELTVLLYQNHKYPMVNADFDSPPFYSILLGLFDFIFFKNDMFDFSFFSIRLFSVILSLISLIVLYFLVRELISYKVALISALFYATEPIIVLTNRLVVTENLLILLMLLSLFFINKYFKTNRKIFFYIASITAGLAAFTKVAGVSVIIILTLILFYRKQWREGFYAGIIGASIFSLYFVYGAIFDWNTFLKVLLEQGDRLQFSVRTMILGSIMGNVVSKSFLSEFILFSWLAIFVSRNKKNNTELLLYMFLSYFLFLVLIVGNFQYSWYKIPLYSFFCVFSALLLVDIGERKSLIKYLVIMFLFVMIPSVWFFDLVPYTFAKWAFRFFLIFFIVLYWVLSKLSSNYYKLTIFSIFGFHIIINILTILLLNTTYYKLFI